MPNTILLLARGKLQRVTLTAKVTIQITVCLQIPHTELWCVVLTDLKEFKDEGAGPVRVGSLSFWT